MSDYFVMRLYQDGARVQKHVLIAAQTRGSLVVRVEKMGRRQSLVARLSVMAPDLPKIPPLYDATLLGTSSSCLAIAGYERVEPTILDQKERLHGQTWLVEPTPMQDLMKVESLLRETAREREELRLQLRALLDERLGRL